MSEKERIIRKALLDPQGAIDALAVREVAFHSKIALWASQEADLAYLESMEKAALLILDSGPTRIRQEFILRGDRQTPLCQGVLDCGGLWGYKNSQLTWISIWDN